jgi:hypothetical protein
MVSVTYTGELTKLELLTLHGWLYFEVTALGTARSRDTAARCNRATPCGDRPALFPIANGPTRDYAIEHPV